MMNNNVISADGHMFEVVDKIPKNFRVWSIGVIEHYEEYIPLCEWLDPKDKDNFSVNTETLKMIKVTADEAAILRKASSWGVKTLKDAEKAIKSKRNGFILNKKRESAKQAIDILRRIS